MSTSGKSSQEAPAATISEDDLTTRKAQHLDICIRADDYAVESGATGFEHVSFVHCALPEIAMDEVDTGTDFLGYRSRLPLFISSMTGGSAEGYNVNKQLARAAQHAGIPVGMGSIRILFRKPEVLDHFRLKELAPDVPVFANIGGVQLRDMDHTAVIEMVKRLGVDALAVHLNPGQELFQPDGDRDFRGVMDAISRFCAASPVPVMAKETGFGISPSLVRELLRQGVTYVDLAGSGGTNWVRVESHRLPAGTRAAADEFNAWGLPTAVILGALEGNADRVLASGGMRTGLDLAKATAMGARLSGFALPMVRAVIDEGVDGVLRYVERLETVLRNVMVLTGSRTLSDLRRCRLMRSRPFCDAVTALRSANGESTGGAAS
ncbi:MAG: type 2 isopentenyl-diphosphate Delta-isomerase [bacterium]